MNSYHGTVTITEKSVEKQAKGKTYFIDREDKIGINFSSITTLDYEADIIAELFNQFYRKLKKSESYKKPEINLEICTGSYTEQTIRVVFRYAVYSYFQLLKRGSSSTQQEYENNFLNGKEIKSMLLSAISYEESK